MKYQLYSVYDAAVGAYGRPMFLNARGQAIRGFTDEVNRAADDNSMYRHPEDYALFYLGEFEDSSGVGQFSVPERVVTALDVFTSNKEV